MANRRRGRGSVDGVSFRTWREAIYLVISKYLEKNPFISYIEFVENTREIQDFSINDNNDRSFIKSEIAYYRLPQNLQRKFYDSRPLNIEGKNYYLKTETDEKHALKVIEFGKKNGISVIVENNQFNNTENNSKSSTCLDEFYNFLLKFFPINDANKYISAIQKVCMDCNVNIDDLKFDYLLVKKIINEYNTFRSEENRNSNGELVLSLKYFILFIKMNSFFKQKNNANDNQQSRYTIQKLNTWGFIPINYSSDYRNKSFDINQQFYSYIDILLKEKSLSKEEFIKKCELRDDFFNMNFIDLETIFKICIKLELNLDQGTILLKQFNYNLDENYFIDELLIVCLYAGFYNIDSLNSIFKNKCKRKIFTIDE